jgi:hypothetical protein
MKLVLIHGSKPETHKFFKPAIDRVCEFAEKYGDEGVPPRLAMTVSGAFLAEQPTALVWIGINEEEEIVAHLMATIDTYFGHNYVMVHQLWVDSGVEFDDKTRAELFDAVATWGRQNGTDEVHCMALNKAVARIFRSKDGFEETGKVSMKRVS